MSDIVLTEQWVLTALIFAAAVLYSTVGHGGASAYLAIMAFEGLAPEFMRPAALVLNMIVAGVASARFWWNGSFSWDAFWPFAVTSVPLAFCGGLVSLSDTTYKRILGAVLLFAAYRLFRHAASAVSAPVRPVPKLPALLIGGTIGFLAGAIGIGGGILLSPIILLARWAETRQTSGVSALFILVNSVAGFAGHLWRGKPVPDDLWPLGIAAVLGGLIGSELGSRRLATTTLRRVLAGVLVAAVVKLLFL